MPRMATAAKARGPYTRADLERTPDDGRRYELIDGHLYVSAAPGWMHQRAAFELAVLLRSARQSGVEVVPGPFAVGFADDTEFQPDIIVGRVEDFTEREITRPLLVVEVLSPSTRLVDLTKKRVRFEAGGIPSYWVVDPIARPAEASLVAWQFGDEGTYRQAARVVGHEAFETDVPFPVRVIPADLVR
jgi:Uma2 family endonuclease